MIFIFQCYKAYIPEDKGAELEETISFLENTSVLLNNFKDKRPYTCMTDSRFAKNRNALDYFTSWEKDVNTKKDLSASQKQRLLMSDESRFDLTCMVIAFEELCKAKFTSHGGSISAAWFNNDIAENIFCQQRALYHGANDNPNFVQYKDATNAILLGKIKTSEKGNAYQNDIFSVAKRPKRE